MDFPDDERLAGQLAFLAELDGLKHVLRRNLVMDESRRENSVEHSWHAAMMALVLGEHAPRGADAARAARMLMLHDVIEIDAGDTFCYDAAGMAAKDEQERLAAERLFGMLPADQAEAFRALWEEFEAGESPDARYAQALDRLHTLIQNARTRGGTWRLYDVPREAVMRRMDPVRTALPDLWPVVLQAVEQAREQGWLK